MRFFAEDEKTKMNSKKSEAKLIKPKMRFKSMDNIMADK